MQHSITFIRILFLALCVLLSTSFTLTEASQTSPLITLIGSLTGLAIGSIIVGFEVFFKKLDLRILNVAAIGLFFGYLLGEAVLLVAQSIIDLNIAHVSPPILAMIRSGVFLITCYLGMAMTARASGELYISIPFIKFKAMSQRKKDLIVDSSALSDLRIIDLAATGLVNQQLIIPNFLVLELQEQAENSDENVRTRARRGLDTIKRLELLPELDLRFSEINHTELKDASVKISSLARSLEANILTADSTRSTQTNVDGVRYININALSSSLKPISQTGEMLNIKIQRYGKEPRQGVGYLDDGTMVVVNGGAEFIGETIRGQVLSVKNTSSGRMIFCNTLENDISNEPLLTSSSSASNYFAQ